MVSFFVSLTVLILGYFFYGVFIEKVFGIKADRKTPAYDINDGVDYIPMPTWKVFLIQFLNIAGLGPIFGAIMGIMYGPAAFLWIALGTIFGGAVHDYLSGMLSLKYKGASLSEVVGFELGGKIKLVMRIFAVVLLIMVGAVFVINPAQLLAQLTAGAAGGEVFSLDFWIIAVFVYYILATLLPIDKIIGNIYPLFGFVLLFMAVAIFFMLVTHFGSFVPEFTDGLHNRHPKPETYQIFPMMFVSIACGAISGFHATQSPLMARCLKNEKRGRVVFYGAMVTEGIVALIWAAAAIAYFKGDFVSLGGFLTSNGASVLVNDLSIKWLGLFGGVLAVLGVVAAPITSGDTALRAARLMVSDFFKFKQDTVVKRLMVSLPIFICCYVVMKVDLDVLWRYFGWSNQTLSVFTLWAVTMFLARKKKAYIVSLIPAMFMTMVCVAYIIFAPEGFSFDNVFSRWICENYPSLGDAHTFDYYLSVAISVVVAMLCYVFFKISLKRRLVSPIEGSI